MSALQFFFSLLLVAVGVLTKALVVNAAHSALLWGACVTGALFLFVSFPQVRIRLIHWARPKRRDHVISTIVAGCVGALVFGLSWQRYIVHAKLFSGQIRAMYWAPLASKEPQRGETLRWADTNTHRVGGRVLIEMEIQNDSGAQAYLDDYSVAIEGGGEIRTGNIDVVGTSDQHVTVRGLRHEYSVSDLLPQKTKKTAIPADAQVAGFLSVSLPQIPATDFGGEATAVVSFSDAKGNRWSVRSQPMRVAEPDQNRITVSAALTYRPAADYDSSTFIENASPPLLHQEEQAGHASTGGPIVVIDHAIFSDVNSPFASFLVEDTDSEHRILRSAWVLLHVSIVNIDHPPIVVDDLQMLAVDENSGAWEALEPVQLSGRTVYMVGDEAKAFADAVRATGGIKTGGVRPKSAVTRNQAPSRAHLVDAVETQLAPLAIKNSIGERMQSSGWVAFRKPAKPMALGWFVSDIREHRGVRFFQRLDSAHSESSDEFVISFSGKVADISHISMDASSQANTPTLPRSTPDR